MYTAEASSDLFFMLTYNMYVFGLTPHTATNIAQIVKRRMFFCAPEKLFVQAS